MRINFSHVAYITKILMVMGLLSSCAVTNVKQAYKDVYYNPDIERYAYLYLDVPYHVTVSFFNDENCTLGKYGTRVNNDDQEAVFSVGGYTPKNTVHNSMKKVKIEAGQPFYVSLNLRKSEYVSEKLRSSLCDFSLRFNPREHSDYVLTYSLGEEKCFTGIIDVTASNEKKEVVKAEGLERLEKVCSAWGKYPEYKQQ
ncbi:hypothetical protein [Kaarinaea lacus]